MTINSHLHRRRRSDGRRRTLPVLCAVMFAVAGAGGTSDVAAQRAAATDADISPLGIAIVRPTAIRP
jgi:hypothetical protein